MIESFIDVFRRLASDENSQPDFEDSSHQKNSEDSFLAVLPVVRKIVRRRFVSLRQTEASDLEQGIVLRLLKWREKYPDISKNMSSGDWESFAARAAYNETNRHLSKNGKAGRAHLPLDAVSEIESPERIVGESDAELQSLALFVWQGICRMTLRQRRALLLQNRKLVLNFLKGGIRDEELARGLEISENEWLEVKIKIPLKDAAIARFGGEQSNLEPAIKSIKKARHEARGKLRKLTNK